MGTSAGKPRYSIAGVLFGQLFCARKYTRPLDLPSLDASFEGKIFVVTGGSAGIGFACAEGLLSRGAKHVHILCRDLARGEKAAEKLGRATAHQVDVSCVRDLQAFAASLPGAVDGLVNNAGALINKRVVANGLESHVGTHLIGLHALTKALAPKLAAGSTVVNVASAGLYGAKLDIQAIKDGFSQVTGADDKLDGALAYAVCKRGQIELTKRWATQLRCVSMHPGWCKTEGLNGLFEAHPSYKVGFDRWRTAADGADTILWLLSGAGESGAFYFDRERAAEHQWFAGTQTDAGDVDLLWEFCESHTKSEAS